MFSKKELLKIIAVTGARSDYDLLSPIYDILCRDPFFEFGLIVTGAHLSERYGMTVTQIENDGYPILERLYTLEDRDDRAGRIISLGNQIAPLTNAMLKHKPDLLLVAGDREESVSVTMTSAYMSIPCAHFFGGDVVNDGNIDNSTRYAATKYAHLHFAVIEEHRRTLLQMGEEPWRIHVCGSPSLDKFISTPEIDRSELSRMLGFELGEEPYIVLIQHPIITRVENQAEDIAATLKAIARTGLKVLIDYPNSDPGNFPIINAIEDYSREHSGTYMFRNLPRLQFVNILRHAAVLAGNSSCGLFYAPSIGLPVVNVGERQRSRIHAENVIFTSYNPDEIYNALQKSLYDSEYRKSVKECINPYGDGKSSKRIVDILKNLKFGDELVFKKFIRQ